MGASSITLIASKLRHLSGLLSGGSSIFISSLLHRTGTGRLSRPLSAAELGRLVSGNCREVALRLSLKKRSPNCLRGSGRCERTSTTLLGIVCPTGLTGVGAEEGRRILGVIGGLTNPCNVGECRGSGCRSTGF